MQVYESPTTIAASARQCLVAFEQYFQRSSFVHPRDLSLVEDQFARFSLWASSTCVFAPSPASMDHRLRGVPDVQDDILGLLEALNDRVQTCTTISGSIQNLTSQSAGDSVVETNAKLELTAKRIASDISLLHRLLSTIRKESREAQDTEAAKSFRIEGDENNDRETPLRKLYNQDLRDRFPDINEIILQRLVSAMVHRSRRILYRRPRGGNKWNKVIGNQEQLFVDVKSRRTSWGKAPTIAPSTTTLNPDQFKMASRPFVVYYSRTVTLGSHQDALFPLAPKSHVRLEYEQLEKNQRPEHVTRAQDLLSRPELQFLQTGATVDAESEPQGILKEDQKWHEAESLEEVCPFCLQTVSSEDELDLKAWQTHINNDLKPYVCLFEECNNPDELYNNSEDWLKHMRQHILRWYCKSKSHSIFVFKSGFQYEQHMREAHKNAFTDDQLRVLTKRISRTIEPMFECCPLCRSSPDDIEGKLEDHIVGHMRLLALKSVPPYYDEDEEIPISECGSNSAGSVGTRSTIKMDRDRDLQLAFDDNDSRRDSDDVDSEDQLNRYGDNRPDMEPPPDLVPGTNATSAIDKEDSAILSKSRRMKLLRWICCQCGGDNSGEMDLACATCCNHWRDSTCVIYDANAR